MGRRIASGIALVITSGLFALAHGAQNFPLFFDRFAFGLMAGLVVILVGGLEAGIALHILNNLLAFGIAIFFGDLEGALTISEVSWWQLPVTSSRTASTSSWCCGRAPDGAAPHDESHRSRRTPLTLRDRPRIDRPRLVGAEAFVYLWPSVRPAAHA